MQKRDEVIKIGHWTEIVRHAMLWPVPKHCAALDGRRACFIHIYVPKASDDTV